MCRQQQYVIWAIFRAIFGLYSALPFLGLVLERQQVEGYVTFSLVPLLSLKSHFLPFKYPPFSIYLVYFQNFLLKGTLSYSNDFPTKLANLLIIHFLPSGRYLASINLPDNELMTLQGHVFHNTTEQMPTSSMKCVRNCR